MHPIRAVAPLALAAALAACAGTGTPTSDPSLAAPSVAPSDPAGGSPSGAPSEATSVEVLATDYAFSDVGTDLDGPISFTMRNDGAELHEMVIVRKNDGVTTSFEELLALPEDEAFAQVRFIGQTMAEPGQTAPDELTVEEPGEYLMVCFVPQGMTEMPSLDPDASGPPDLGDGPPHFVLGMLREFSVSQ